MDVQAVCRANRKRRKIILGKRRTRARLQCTENIEDSGLLCAEEHLDIQAIYRINRKKRKSILDRRKLRTRVQFSQNEEDSEMAFPIIPLTSPRCFDQLDIGLPEYECQSCGALLWYAERIYKAKNETVPKFSLCCQEGRISIPLLREAPAILNSLLDYQGSRNAAKFRECIRIYNSMFAFTSLGAKIDTEINKRPGPYIFRINGQNHHILGSLLPADGQQPKFAQLYIYDTENELDNRMKAIDANRNMQNIDVDTVALLTKMFDDHNEIVKAFRMARDRFRESSCYYG